MLKKKKAGEERAGERRPLLPLGLKSGWEFAQTSVLRTPWEALPMVG